MGSYTTECIVGWQKRVLFLGTKRARHQKFRCQKCGKPDFQSFFLISRCRMTRSMGTSASVVGGSLTIAGGILTLTTAGAAAPLLIAGIATSSAGAATNIGTSVVERTINSRYKVLESCGVSIERYVCNERILKADHTSLNGRKDARHQKSKQSFKTKIMKSRIINSRKFPEH